MIPSRYILDTLSTIVERFNVDTLVYAINEISETHVIFIDKELYENEAFKDIELDIILYFAKECPFEDVLITDDKSYINGLDVILKEFRVEFNFIEVKRIEHNYSNLIKMNKTLSRCKIIPSPGLALRTGKAEDEYFPFGSSKIWIKNPGKHKSTTSKSCVSVY